MLNRQAATLLLIALICGGCFTTQRDVRAQEPAYTRRGLGAASEMTAYCIQDYVQDHFDGTFGRAGGVVFEVRREETATQLIGRDWMRPSLVAFVVSLIPAGSNEVEAQLRIASYVWPGVRGAGIEGIKACVSRPAG
jgi:hypothetical protein